MQPAQEAGRPALFFSRPGAEKEPAGWVGGRAAGRPSLPGSHPAALGSHGRGPLAGRSGLRDGRRARLRGEPVGPLRQSLPAGQVVRLRHHHPPLIAYMTALALTRGSGERIVRAPSVFAGALTVALIYLCGLALFRTKGDPDEEDTERSGAPAAPPRSAALACAAIVIVTPPHIRGRSPTRCRGHGSRLAGRPALDPPPVRGDSPGGMAGRSLRRAGRDVHHLRYSSRPSSPCGAPCPSWCWCC